MRGGLDDALEKLARRDELRRRAAGEATGTPPAVTELVEAIAVVVGRNPQLAVTVGVEGAGDPVLLHFAVDDGTVQVSADNTVARAAEAGAAPKHADFDIELDDPVEESYVARYDATTATPPDQHRVSFDDRDRYDPGTGYDSVLFDGPTASQRPDTPVSPLRAETSPAAAPTSAVPTSGPSGAGETTRRAEFGRDPFVREAFTRDEFARDDLPPEDVRRDDDRRDDLRRRDDLTSGYDSQRRFDDDHHSEPETYGTGFDAGANGRPAAEAYPPHPFAATPPPPVPPQTTRRIYPEQHRAPEERTHSERVRAAEERRASGHRTAGNGTTQQRGMPTPLPEPIPLRVDPGEADLAAKRLAAMLREDPSLLHQLPPE